MRARNISIPPLPTTLVVSSRTSQLPAQQLVQRTMTETASIVSSRSSTHRRGGPGLNVNLNDDVRSRTGRTLETASMYSRNDDATTLTLFGNPFENDEKEDTPWSSLLSKVKNTFSAPVSATLSTTVATLPSSSGATSPPVRLTEESHGVPSVSRRPSNSKSIVSVGTSARVVQNKTFALRQTSAAPPLVSLTPVISEQPSFPGDNHSDGGSMRGASPGPGYFGGSMEPAESGHYGHFIPGFPINDDAKSVRTTASGGRRNESASKVIRRLRGQGRVRALMYKRLNCAQSRSYVRAFARVLDGRRDM